MSGCFYNVAMFGSVTFYSWREFVFWLSLFIAVPVLLVIIIAVGVVLWVRRRSERD